MIAHYAVAIIHFNTDYYHNFVYTHFQMMRELIIVNGTFTLYQRFITY